MLRSNPIKIDLNEISIKNAYWKCDIQWIKRHTSCNVISHQSNLYDTRFAGYQTKPVNNSIICLLCCLYRMNNVNFLNNSTNPWIQSVPRWGVSRRFWPSHYSVCGCLLSQVLFQHRLYHQTVARFMNSTNH